MSDAGILKAVGSDLLPCGLSHSVRFALARKVGFTHVEMVTVDDPGEVEVIRKAALTAGIGIHSVKARTGSVNLHGTPGEIEQAVEHVATTMKNALAWSASTVLLVPGRVDAKTPYDDVWSRSRETIRERLLPLADHHDLVLGIENVWYGFLLTPTEYTRYIDDLGSPRARAYLDVGNMIFGFPQHWIRAAGSRIAQVHLKDFQMGSFGGTARFLPVGEGATDWAAVRAAFREVAFSGGVTTTAVPMPARIPFLNRLRDHLEYRRRFWPFLRRPVDALRLREYEKFLADMSRRFDWFWALDPS